MFSLFMMRMKGQYRIVNEILLFAIGIGLVGFIAITFHSLEDWVGDMVMRNQLESVSNLIVTGIIRVFETGNNATLIIKIPAQISNRAYEIIVEDNQILLFDIENQSLSVREELFYIPLNKTIKGSIVSSAEYIVIKSNSTDIELKRLGE